MDRLIIYQILHLSAVILIFTALGGRLVETVLLPNPKKSPLKRWISVAHGLGMLCALIGGFGMMARLGIGYPFPVWIWVKILIWLSLGGMLAVIPRTPKYVKIYWFVLIILAGTAATMAIVKPF
jgi:hypothetical protein